MYLSGPGLWPFDGHRQQVLTDALYADMMVKPIDIRVTSSSLQTDTSRRRARRHLLQVLGLSLSCLHYHSAHAAPPYLSLPATSPPSHSPRKLLSCSMQRCSLSGCDGPLSNWNRVSLHPALLTAVWAQWDDLPGSKARGSGCSAGERGWCRGQCLMPGRVCAGLLLQ